MQGERSSKELDAWRGGLRAFLECWRAAGVRQLPGRAASGSRRIDAPHASPPDVVAREVSFGLGGTAASVPTAVQASPPPDAISALTAPLAPLDEFAAAPAAPDQAAPSSTREQALALLAREVGGCLRCQELVDNRTQTVFGVGDPNARLCFLGEAPGADEDQQGEPFVGAAGKLLTKILEACRLTREDVYILNVLKCRPPNNRTPEPVEVSHCREYLQRQLEIIRPEFICCLGGVAARSLLDTTRSVGDLRGTFHRYGDIRVVVTYHPAYLLRTPSAKRATWDDMRMLMNEMGVSL